MEDVNPPLKMAAHHQNLGTPEMGTSQKGDAIRPNPAACRLFHP